MNYLKKVLATLKKARKLIGKRSNWTVRACFRNKYGHEVSNSKNACKFCSLGALMAVADDADVRSACMAELNNMTKNNSIIHFNDYSSHEKVLAVWDKTIARVNEILKAEKSN